MNAMMLLLSLMLQLAPATAAADQLPGTAYARPPAGTVLRAGAGADFPGAVTLDGQSVVRVGELVGTFRQVFVPQGFTCYMHTDYLTLSPSDATVMVRGDGVNVRLLPAVGLPPITQLPAGAGPLVLLGLVNEWARVLAPIDTPLYATDESLPAATDADAAARWSELFAMRETQRQAAIAGWRATDPEYQRESLLLDEVERLADTDLATLDAPARAARHARLAELWAAAGWERTRTIIGNLRVDLDAVDTTAAAGAKATEDVRQDVRAQPAPAGTAASLDLAALKKESRMLALGFRFRGKGDSVSRSGSVHKEGIDGSPVYTLHGKDGEILKLTAPSEVATLEALVGKQVELDGRRLFLTTVDGPVLVVDKVVSYRPR